MDQEERLKKVTKEVYQQGFNIHMMIQKMNKQLNLMPTRDKQPGKKQQQVTIPSEVIIRVCQAYLKYQETVRNKYGWFLSTFTKISREYSAEQNIKKNMEYKKKDKKGPQLMRDILRKMYEGKGQA